MMTTPLNMTNIAMLLLLGFCHCALGGNILVWMGVGSKSHYNAWKPLVLQLARRNHSMTVVAPHGFPEVEALPNVRYMLVATNIDAGTDSHNIFAGNMYDFTQLFQVMVENQDVLMKDPGVLSLIQEKPQFDVTFIDPFCPDIGVYLAKKLFNSPMILYLTASRQPHIDQIMGNPIIPSYIPTEVIGLSQHMTFKERIVNTLVTAYFLYMINFVAGPPMEAKVQEVLNLKEKPDLAGLMNDADFAFLNSHPVLENVVPTNPNTALLGGMHLRESKPLSGDLKEWLDGAKEGAILISFGSAKRKLFIELFSKLKQRVVWKWETEQMPDTPKNVLLKKWLPQQDVLGHPNVKLFISHGGLLSLQESLYHKVPMVVIPGFADQFSNAGKAVRMGFGKELSWSTLNSEDLLETVQAILSDKSFGVQADHFGTIMKDDLMPSLDRGIYYTEYVMRHKGAPHLRSPARDLAWYQYLLIDVLAFLMLVVLAVVFVACKLVKAGIRWAFSGSAKQRNKLKRK